MAFLEARNTISGTEGRAYATIGGQVFEMFYVKKLEAKVEKEKAEIKTLGRRVTQHRASGWKGTGSMTIYYVTSKFRELMLDYIKTGVDTYFDIMVVNESPASNIGNQTVVVKGVNLDSVIMASLDTEAEALEEEIAFTFEDVEVLNAFTTLQQQG
ncbi:Phage tail tube protein [Paenibacillus sp. UNCCL117]|uniref:phage tail tube protein n=1 Tax=unclassified Paenibacillus TaxID=185978 RepID=UPI00088AA004|nr:MULTISPECIES: phage tail tube protein [unclassified Paenibacillus]SDD75427.1 Phage tail tube protein [Paenibacillus sp. cl123]SFW52165.1 Phage tail tube protein [Paenibacillus sp. UNCCL117]